MGCRVVVACCVILWLLGDSDVVLGRLEGKKVKKAVFFDRDGVINRDYGYVGTLERFEFLPSVKEALADIKAMGYATILVTNQSGIARGLYTVDDFDTVTEFMQGELSKTGAQFDGIYFCPHHPQASVAQFRCECTCRKPKPEMFFWAQKEHDLDLEHSIMVGDHASDIEAAKSAGVKNLFLIGEHLQTDGTLVPEAQKYADLATLVAAMKQNAITLV